MYDKDLVVGLNSESDHQIQSLVHQVSEIDLLILDCEDEELESQLEQDKAALVEQINEIRSGFKR